MMDQKCSDSPASLVPRGWVLVVILSLAAIEPVSHWAIETFPPAGTVPTGAHIVDTTNYLAGMENAHPPYTSPYARCGTEEMAGSLSLYPLIHHHVYGFVGMLCRLAGVDPFHGLAWANGLGAAFCAWAAWLFLAIGVPRLARRAFLLYALGGGLGGLLYLGGAVAGWTDQPEFGPAFMRYFYYELSEGPRFQPWLMVARLYYTLSLGCGLLALSLWLHWLRGGNTRMAWQSALLLALCTVLNLRLGPVFWGVAVLMACTVGDRPWKGRLLAFAAPTAALGLCAVGVLQLAALNPALFEGVAVTARSALWLSPFVSATFFYWFVVPLALPGALGPAPPLLRGVAMGALGYTVAFIALYLVYQVYYGNYLRLADTMVAVRISDWALLGIVPGCLLTPWIARRRAPSETDAPAWAALWLLALFPLAISAWGQGWYLRFSPDRLVITLGIPMAILAAATLESWKATRPRAVRLAYGLVLGCGLLSAGVTWAVTYGPLGYHTLQQHYSWTRFAFMKTADAALLDVMESGVVLAPSLGAPLFGDLAILQPETQTVYGNGTLDYSREVMPVVRSAVAEFFSLDRPDELRRALVEQWCVRYVYCPATDPLPPALCAELEATPWLEVVLAMDGGMVLEVKR